MSESQNTFNREQNTAACEAILADPPRGLETWLRDEGLELADAKDEPWASIVVRLRSRGVQTAAMDWRRSSKRELRLRGVSQRDKVLSMLVNRFIDARMQKSSEWVRPLRDTPADLSFLADYMRWVAEHPGLYMQVNEKTGCCETCKRPYRDPVVRAIIEQYELNNPPPSQLAISLFERCRSNLNALDAFLAQVANHSRDHLKRTGAPSDEDKIKTPGEDRLLDLDAELAEMGSDDQD